MLCVPYWTPDDGRKDRPKHAEWYLINSKQCASSWFYNRNIAWIHLKTLFSSIWGNGNWRFAIRLLTSQFCTDFIPNVLNKVLRANYVQDFMHLYFFLNKHENVLYVAVVQVKWGEILKGPINSGIKTAPPGMLECFKVWYRDRIFFSSQ
jgi:hypothetical protein